MKNYVQEWFKSWIVQHFSGQDGIENLFGTCTYVGLCVSVCVCVYFVFPCSCYRLFCYCINYTALSITVFKDLLCYRCVLWVCNVYRHIYNSSFQLGDPILLENESLYGWFVFLPTHLYSSRILISILFCVFSCYSRFYILDTMIAVGW